MCEVKAVALDLFAIILSYNLCDQTFLPPLIRVSSLSKLKLEDRAAENELERAVDRPLSRDALTRPAQATPLSSRYECHLRVSTRTRILEEQMSELQDSQLVRQHT